MKWKWTCKLLSHVQLFATPLTTGHEAPLSMGILQARKLKGSAISFSRGSSRLRDRTWASWMTGRFFTIWATDKLITTQYTVLNSMPTIFWAHNSVSYMTGGSPKFSQLFLFLFEHKQIAKVAKRMERGSSCVDCSCCWLNWTSSTQSVIRPPAAAASGSFQTWPYTGPR